MEKNVVLLERMESGVAKLTLNTPPLNLITTQVNHRLDELLDEITEDRTIRVVVLTGAGEKAFSAGADIKEFADFVKKGTMVSEKLHLECNVFNKVEDLPQPTIAALNGITLGGGIELALCCDFRIMGECVKVGFPEIGIGLFPGSGGLVRLPRLVGKTRAKELMFFGEKITAQRAMEIGLVDEVCPNEQVLSRAIERAESLAKLPSDSLRAVKRGIQDVAEMPIQQGVEYSLGLISRLLSTEDAREGVNAFLEKRNPVFNQN